MQIPAQVGVAWWSGLSSQQKEEIVGQLLDEGKSSSQIAEKLHLDTRNKVVTVRARVKAKRTESGISMEKWHRSNESSSLPRARSQPHRRSTVERSPQGQPLVPRQVRDEIAAVIIPPIVFDDSPEALAPHLYRARPYDPDIDGPYKT